MSLAPLDSIALTGLAAHGRHGVFDFEREQGQMFTADVEVFLPIDTEHDDLTHTVDYSVLARDIVEIIAGPPVRLIETLAGLIADRCLAEPAVEAVKVCVHKPQAPVDVELTDVSVTLNRSKQ